MTLFFFFNDTATTEIYTLSLHDALPISAQIRSSAPSERPANSRTKRSGLRRSIPAGGGAGTSLRTRATCKRLGSKRHATQRLLSPTAPTHVPRAAADRKSVV